MNFMTVLKVILIQTTENILLSTFPVKQQLYDYDCADTAFWCVLHYFGSNITYDEIIKILHTDPAEGTYNINIIKALDQLEVKYIAESSTIEKLRDYAFQNYPTVIDIQYRKEKGKSWANLWLEGHYEVVLEVTDTEVKLMDPDYGQIRSMPINKLLEAWHDEDADVKYQNYAITCFSKEK